MEADPEQFPGGPEEGEPGEPPSRRRRQEEEPEEGAADDYPGLDQAAVSREQEAELQAALGGEGGGGGGAAAVSFLELCERPPGGAEAAAQRFLSLLALHMEGAVTVSQEEPYGDILIGRGANWSAAPVGGVAVVAA